jgi:nicotinate-nucleotide adenylyltransferase
MLNHKWIEQPPEKYSIIDNDGSWLCSQCGACGGPACWEPEPFINKKIGGPSLNLPEDCEESARLIKEYRDTKTVAIYGGSFDPVTWGHVVSVVNFFHANQYLDEVVVIPCFQQEGKNLIDFHHRFKMCELAFSHLNKVTVSNVEFTLGGESRTHRTLQHLKDANPYWSMHLILGEDLKDSYKTWPGINVIEKLARPIIAPRPKSSRTDCNNGMLLDISSTDVRRYIKYNSYGSSWLERNLPAPVLNYIKENKLYQD